MAFSLQLSEKRLLGWEPTEVQVHEYDDQGRMVRTVVTRESEWDDEERQKMLGLALYESQICACGLHESLAKTDPDVEIVLPVCPVCAGFERQKRILNAADAKRVGDNPAPETPLPSDGRSTQLRLKASVAEKSPGEKA